MWQKFLLWFGVGNFYEWPANDFEQVFELFENIYKPKTSQFQRKTLLYCFPVLFGLSWNFLVWQKFLPWFGVRNFYNLPENGFENLLGYLKHWEAKTLHNFNAKRFLVLPNSRYFKLEFSNVTEILLGFEAGNFYDWPANDFEKCLRYFKTFTSQKASQYERKTILIAFQFSTF